MTPQPTGIDVYTRYQRVTDWEKVRAAGHTFCYVKAADGLEPRDTANYGRDGTAAGIAMGGYLYAEPGDAVKQAECLVQQASQAGLTRLAPALDLEAPPFAANSDTVDFVVAFLGRIGQLGHQPCLYGSNDLLSGILDQVKKRVSRFRVWVARYGASPPTVDFDLWQYSENGQVDGILVPESSQPASVDLNQCGALGLPYNDGGQR